jgi:hypothetical protein
MLKLKTNHWKQGKFVRDALSLSLSLSLTHTHTHTLFLETMMIDNVQYKRADFSGNFLSKIRVLLLVMKRLLVKLRALCLKGMNFHTRGWHHLFKTEPLMNIILIAGMLKLR